MINKWAFLLRAFFPSWEFFVDAGPELRLEVRYANAHESLTEWENCLPKIPRGFHFFDEQINFLHACHNLIEHLLNDLFTLEVPLDEQVQNLTSYRLAHNLVRFRLMEQNIQARRYQFRVTVLDAKAENNAPEVALLSPEYSI